jgi:Chalcone isomerase-like
MRDFECGVRRKLLHAGALAILAPAACAGNAEIAPETGQDAHRAPAEIAAALPSARLQGSGTKRFLGLAVYDASLWVTSALVAERFEKQPFALSLRYARDFEGAAIARRSIDEMRHAGPIDNARAAAWLAAMAQSFPDVLANDRLTGLHWPGQSARFFHNGQPIAPVADAAFAQRFFGIWLATTTSDASLRRQLIGLGS